MLFGQRQSMEEGARAFVAERFARIKANEGSHPLPVEQGGMVVHLVPMQDLAEGRRIETGTLRDAGKSLAPIGASGWNNQINLDGIYAYRGGEVCHGYTQVFRSGSIEATDCSIIREHKGRRLLPSKSLPKELLSALPSYCEKLKTLEVSTPIMLQIAFWGTKNLEIGIDLFMFGGGHTKYQHNQLLLPASVIEDANSTDQVNSVIVEQMDFLWNAFGFEKCHYFDADGNWTG
jgi:hypothetical protein